MRVSAVIFWLCAAVSLTHESGLAGGRIVFPQDPSVLDVKRDFGAVGNGVANDTAALQAGIDASCGIGGNSRVLFIPNGVYLVTNTLVVKKGTGPWVYGESRDGAIIRLADGATNAATNCTAVIRTHPSDTQASSADFFMRNFRNLTIDAGRNPSVDGIRWYGNNTSILKDLRVRGAGKVGINSAFLGQNGPNLVQDVVVEGFETGIASSWVWGQTISRATIRDGRKVGLYVNANSVAVEDLVVENTPGAVFNDYPNDWTWWGGVIALVGARFSGGDPAQPAITNRNVLYARNVSAAGFKQVLSSATPGGSDAGNTLTEYASHPVTLAFTNSPGRSFKLPIKREPEVPWETDPAKWVCANTNGARFGDNNDDTAALQKTIDLAAAAGATTVYLRGIGGGDPNWYTLNGEVRVHGSVRHIIALGFGRIIAGPNGRFVVDDTSAPAVKFQHLQAFGGTPPTVENRSAHHSVVLESCDCHVLGTGGGDLFVTDCASGVELRSAGQSLWARQLNPEGNDNVGLVRNSGGKLWILGLKHEGSGVRVRTDNGGQTEIFGVFNYGPGVGADDPRPMFDIDNAAFCAMGVREISFGNTFPVKVREVRNGQVRTATAGGWIGWSLYSGWEPALTNGPSAAAMPWLEPAQGRALHSGAAYVNGGNHTWNFPADGTFLRSLSLTSFTSTAGSQLRYTTDNSEPNTQSPLWPGLLTLTNTTTVQLKAFAERLAPSATCTGLWERLTLQRATPGVGPTNGLSYAYYELPGGATRLPDFATLNPVTNGTVASFDLAPRLRTNNIAFRFTGCFTAPATGIYTFYLNSEAGARLWLGPTLVADTDGAHAPREAKGRVALEAGQHPIRLDYFNAVSAGKLAVSYDGPGIKKQAIPDRALVGRGESIPKK